MAARLTERQAIRELDLARRALSRLEEQQLRLIQERADAYRQVVAASARLLEARKGAAA